MKLFDILLGLFLQHQALPVDRVEHDEVLHKWQLFGLLLALL
jgi:hypothetical protein